jgi:hypothetical protein
MQGIVYRLKIISLFSDIWYYYTLEYIFYIKLNTDNMIILSHENQIVNRS